MNRNILKWVLIAAVVLGAAAYLILSETPSKKEPKKEKIVVGHSKAFKIEPIEGITISAGENALDKNREFKLKPVDDKTYNRVVKRMEEEAKVNPLFVFELDAGLRPDDYFPGDYHVEVDLNKMGIPKILQDRICVYRIAGSGKEEVYVPYSSRVVDGKLSFNSNQNSLMMFALTPHDIAIELLNNIRGALHFIFETGASAGKSLQRYFYNEPTRIEIPIKHPSGDFTLKFRWRDTEDPDGFNAYMANEEAFFKRLDELEKQAHDNYEAKVQKEFDKEGITIWDKVFSPNQVQAIRDRINYQTELQSLFVKDSLIAKLQADPASKPPKSIQNIIQDVVRANEYLNSIGLHHLNFELPIYLVNDEVMKKKEGKPNDKNSGVAQKYWVSGNAFMLLRYEVSELTPQSTTGWEKLLCTLVHEFSHVRQQCYYSLICMNSAPAEATAVVVERDAAKQWYKNNIIKSDPEDRIVLNNVLTERADHNIFGHPLDNIPKLGSNGADKAYTMGDAIESIREGSGKGDVTMEPFLSSYSIYGPHTTGWTGWIKKSLNIDDDQLRKGWVYFGERHLQLIYESQTTASDETKTENYTLKPTTPLIQLKRLSKPINYAVNTFKFTVPEDKDGDTVKMPHVFVYRKGDMDPYVTFYWSDYKFEEYNKKSHGSIYLLRAEPSVFYTGNRATDFHFNGDGIKFKNKYKRFNEYYLAAVSTTPTLGPKPDYYVVALFPPEQLTLRKVKEDKITFVVPKPERKLTKEKLITGAVITYKDKNGNEVTRDVKAKDFGRKATWSITGCTKPGNRFSLSMHWYYQADSQTVYESPESEPVTWGAKGNKPEEEAKPTKEPKTNYWKQVNVRMNKSNSSFKESQDSDEEVSPDYRSIDFVVDKTEKSCDFSGMAATEETSPDGKTRYVGELYMTGTLTYTEPPVYWIPTQQYKARWDIADDPYFMKIKEPFVFEAKNTSSNQAACTQSKKDKIDTGHSTTGKVNWLRSASTTFEARFPEKDSPKFFTLTQTYSIKEREGSNLMATVTFEYDYEWVGEPEEEEKEEETAPEGGYWQLVKIETDDSHSHKTYKSCDCVINATVSGENGNYSVHYDFIDDKEKCLFRTIDRQIHGDIPKQYYIPGKDFDLKCINEKVQDKILIEGKGMFKGTGEVYSDLGYYPFGFLYKSSIKDYKTFSVFCSPFGYDYDTCRDRFELELTPVGVVPEKKAYYKEGFVIFQKVGCRTTFGFFGDLGDLYLSLLNYYFYEWVDGEQKEEDLGNLGIGIEFPMNAKDKAYFGEHGGSLLHRNDFGVKIPSGSYSVKKSGKGYILEGSGHSESSSPSPRASHNIEVRIVLDKNKIPVEASFSCQGFYEGTIRTMKTETTTFQATGTAKLTEKELGPNSRRGKCTSFNGIIHTESEGDFDYSNTEGGHLTIRWKCD